ncbi:hypothetical protein SERLA73DRAFT_45288, partial [Serpula lacrymans var. lacrymans S7.3]
QDIVNPHTPHQDIMVLANTDAADDRSPTLHPFLYARSLSIFHANVVYIGSNLLD